MLGNGTVGKSVPPLRTPRAATHCKRRVAGGFSPYTAGRFLSISSVPSRVHSAGFGQLTPRGQPRAAPPASIDTHRASARHTNAAMQDPGVRLCQFKKGGTATGEGSWALFVFSFEYLVLRLGLTPSGNRLRFSTPPHELQPGTPPASPKDRQPQTKNSKLGTRSSKLETRYARSTCTRTS